MPLVSPSRHFGGPPEPGSRGAQPTGTNTASAASSSALPPSTAEIAASAVEMPVVGAAGSASFGTGAAGCTVSSVATARLSSNVAPAGVPRWSSGPSSRTSANPPSPCAPGQPASTRPPEHTDGKPEPRVARRETHGNCRRCDAVEEAPLGHACGGVGCVPRGPRPARRAALRCCARRRATAPQAGVTPQRPQADAAPAGTAGRCRKVHAHLGGTKTPATSGSPLIDVAQATEHWLPERAQLAHDADRAPRWALPSLPTDQCLDLAGDGRSTGTSPPAVPPPMAAPCAAMPADPDVCRPTARPRRFTRRARSGPRSGPSDPRP